MSRAKGTANLAASLEVLAGAPLDAREKVPTKADLYIAANFPYPYVGLETYVVSENKKYRLIGNDVTVEANWQEVGSGGGGGTTVVANPEGEATDELEKLQVGNDIFSIPEENVEINKAQFDALPAATKNNGKAYYIPDANILTNFTVMGNRFDKANIYDTTERMVGRWIDGKPLYQIVKQIETLPKNSGWSVLDDNFVVGTLIGAVTIDPSNRPLYNGGQEVPRWNVDSSTHKVTYSNQTAALSNIAVVFQYTKTTDAIVAVGTENDYSTDEMIIGTWIDGKPVYQKSISGTTGAKDTDTSIGFISDSIETVVDIYGLVKRANDRWDTIGTPLSMSIQSNGNLYACPTVAALASRPCVATVKYTKTTD